MEALLIVVIMDHIVAVVVMAMQDILLVLIQVLALATLLTQAVINMKRLMPVRLQRTLVVLCLLALTSCASSIREWQIEETCTQSNRFNSGRLLLSPTDDCEYLEIEIVRNYSGIRFYLNLFFLQALPLKEDPSRTTLEVITECPSKEFVIYPYLLAGGQRILLDGTDADLLIKMLNQHQEFKLKLGRHVIEVIPTKFAEHYQTLINIPI